MTTLKTRNVRARSLRTGQRLARGVTHPGEAHTIESIERSGGYTHVTFADAFIPHGGNTRTRKVSWCDESLVLLVVS